MDNKKLNESLVANDLKWIVSDNILVDMHRTKLGDDSEYIVLSIPVDDRTPAIDLAQFIEQGYADFEDIEVSPATDTDGRYLVFVEIKRSPAAFQSTKNILTDVSRLAGINEWKFKSLDMQDYITFDEESFSSNVITSPEEYNKLYPDISKHEDNKDIDMDTVKITAEESIQESIKKRYRFLMKY